MKKIIVVAFFIITILSGCDKEEALPRWIGAGSIVKAVELADEFSILLDNGDQLFPNKIIENSNFKDEDRVVVYYSITDKIDDASLNVNIFNIVDILTKDVLQLTESIQDSIGNDPIYINENNIWIANNHLNFDFIYHGGYSIHYINLVKLFEDTHTEDDKLILEFRHNANNDPSNVLMSGIVSFRLESLRIADEDSVDILVRILEYEDEILEWEGSYTFNNPLKTEDEVSPSVKLNKSPSVYLR
ncbi:MAG: hypothetical protein GY834_15260 [Bacteroidetes bacterium]|nr:hypothetical protein [Bacteroidota bacterium]